MSEVVQLSECYRGTPGGTSETGSCRAPNPEVLYLLSVLLQQVPSGSYRPPALLPPKQETCTCLMRACVYVRGQVCGCVCLWRCVDACGEHACVNSYGVYMCEGCEREGCQ